MPRMFLALPRRSPPVQMASCSHLPSRMEMHARQQKLMAAAASENARFEDSSGHHTARGRARSVPPEQIRDMLSRKQQRWDQVLAATKQKRRRVAPRVRPLQSGTSSMQHDIAGIVCSAPYASVSIITTVCVVVITRLCCPNVPFPPRTVQYSVFSLHTQCIAANRKECVPFEIVAYKKRRVRGQVERT